MSAFRTDIQALRAIAVLLVLAFHVWPTRITGGYVGVDVFFVISGYLITGHLLREVASTGRVDLPAFYARRARRLLPAASLTLVLVGLAAYLWMPAFTWKTVAADMAASTLYVENWALVRRSVDYLAQGQTPSPLQHFWSLAVEEQFYVGWPLLVAGVAATRMRRTGAKPAALFGAALPYPPGRAYALPMGMLCCLSFVTSLCYAHANPAAGYFMTHVRLFELGLGGLLGVWAARAPSGSRANIKLGKLAAQNPVPRWQRTLCAAAGLAAIGASGCLYTTKTPFPGVAALVPVLGAAAVIVAGEGVGPGNMSHAHALAPALAHPWLQYVGDISYSLYLAHWPVVVMYPFITGRAVDGMLADGVTVLALSWALAHACKRGWEDLFRSAASKAVGSDDVGESFGEAPLDNPGSIARHAARCWSNPLAVTFGATFLSMAAAVGFALWLHQQTPPLQDLVVDESARQASQPLALVADNGTDIACQPCPYFSGIHASELYPGADAVLHGCPRLNSLPLSAVRPPLSTAKDFERKQHPCQQCFEGPPGNITEMVASQPPCAAELETASAYCKHVVLLGDSHAEHYWPAFNVISKRMGFYFTLLNRAACPPTVALTRRGNPPEGIPDKGCQQFVGNAVSWILHARPSLVILGSHNFYGAIGDGTNGTAVGAGVVVLAKRLIEAGIPVLGMKGTPTMKEDVPTCLSKELARMGGSANVTACSVPRSEGLKESMAPGYYRYPIDEAARMYPILRLLSLDDTLCPDGLCPPVIGNVPVYRDQHHLTIAFAQTLGNALERKLRETAPHLGRPCYSENHRIPRDKEKTM